MTGFAALWPVLAFGLSAATIGVLSAASPRLPLAYPSERGLHAAPVPRVGGLAIWAGWLPVAIAAPPAVPGPWVVWLLALAAVAAVSLADDVRGAGIGTRLAVQFGAASAVVAMLAAGPHALPAAGLAVAGVAMMWGANLFNFMDGSDGLAGIMATLGFTAYAVAAGEGPGAWVPYAALAAACLPFLARNLPPASMFMGDVGSIPLGFLAAALGVAGVAQGAWPAWFPVLVFLPFVLDATVTLARRALRGERVWQPHREHYYQRLHRMGFGHRGTLAVFAGMMLASAGAAVAVLAWQPAFGPALLALFCAIHAALFLAIDYHWGRQQGSR